MKPNKYTKQSHNKSRLSNQYDLSNLSIPYLQQDDEDDDDDNYTIIFDFDCKKILHLWLASILPGVKYLNMHYNLSARTIRGEKQLCLGKIKECNQFLQERKMKLVSDIFLDFNKQMYLTEKIKLKIYDRKTIEAACKDLIHNEKLVELQPQIKPILSTQNVYLISILKIDEDFFTNTFDYVKDNQITRTHIKKIKSFKDNDQTGNQANTHTQKAKGNKKNVKYVEKQQVQIKSRIISNPVDSDSNSNSVTVSDDDDNDDSQTDRSQTSVSVIWSNNSMIVNSDGQSNNNDDVSAPMKIFTKVNMINQNGKIEQKTIFWSICKDFLDLQEFKKWINKHKILQLKEIQTVIDQKGQISIQLKTNKSKIKKQSSLNFYFYNLKSLLLNDEQVKILPYFQSVMKEYTNKTGVEWNIFEGYVKPDCDEIQINELFHDRKIQQHPSGNKTKKVTFLKIKGVLPQSNQALAYFKKFLLQNVANTHAKEQLKLQLTKIVPYLKQKIVKQKIQQIVTQITKQISNQIKVQDIILKNDQIIAILSIQKAIYSENIVKSKQKIAEEVQKQVFLKQRINPFNLNQQLRQNNCFVDSIKQQNKLALIEREDKYNRIDKKMTDLAGKLQTKCFNLKLNRLFLYEQTLKGMEQDFGLKSKTQKIDEQNCNIQIYGSMPIVNRGYSILENRKDKFNKEILEQYYFIDARTVTILQQNIKNYRSILRNDFNTNISLVKVYFQGIVSISRYSETSIDDPIVAYIISNTNLSILPTFSTVFFTNIHDIQSLDENIFEDEKFYLKSQNKNNEKGTIEIQKKKMKLVAFYKDASPADLVSEAFKILYPSSNFEQNLTFFLPQTEKSQFIIKIIHAIHSRKRVNNFKIFFFDKSNKSISQQLKSLQEFQTTYLKKSESQYFIKDGPKRLSYSTLGVKKLKAAQKTNQNIVYLYNDDLTLQMEEATHLCCFKSEKLTHIATGKQYSLMIYPDRVNFQMEGVDFEIPQDIVRKVEKSGKQGVKIVLTIYQINLAKGEQKNLFTNYKRKLQKKQVSIPNIFGHQFFHYAQNQRLDQIEITHFIDEEDKARKAMQKIRSLLEAEKHVFVHKTSFQVGLDKIQKLKQIAKDAQVEIQWNGASQIKISGLQNIGIEIIKNHIDFMLQSGKNVQYPKQWADQKQQIETFVVAKNSPEFQKIANLFKVKQIKELLRIQNKYVWRKYYDEQQSLRHLNDGKHIKQMLLFHGTKNLNPKSIYQDKEQCFNVNYTSDNNYLGRGAYFAEQAKYSLNYEHVQRQKLEQAVAIRSMFLCKVLVGDSQKFEKSTDQLKNIVDTNYKDHVKKLRYESNTMYTNKSNIWAVYKNRRAYPAYLIKYQ